ncbi:hypothetical protein QJS66_05805 [Kocuria rhizophila]|nr:hypothetical protein QJS66_05805 [Kocuria rhizophila]
MAEPSLFSVAGTETRRQRPGAVRPPHLGRAEAGVVVNRVRSASQEQHRLRELRDLLGRSWWTRAARPPVVQQAGGGVARARLAGRERPSPLVRRRAGGARALRRCPPVSRRSSCDAVRDAREARPGERPAACGTLQGGVSAGVDQVASASRHARPAAMPQHTLPALDEVEGGTVGGGALGRHSRRRTWVAG